MQSPFELTSKLAQRIWIAIQQRCQLVDSRYIGRLSAYMLTEATYSTHDPCVLDFSHHHDVLHLVAV